MKLTLATAALLGYASAKTAAHKRANTRLLQDFDEDWETYDDEYYYEDWETGTEEYYYEDWETYDEEYYYEDWETYDDYGEYYYEEDWDYDYDYDYEEEDWDYDSYYYFYAVNDDLDSYVYMETWDYDTWYLSTEDGSYCTLTSDWKEEDNMDAGLWGFFVTDEYGYCPFVEDEGWTYSWVNYAEDGLVEDDSIVGPYGYNWKFVEDEEFYEWAGWDYEEDWDYDYEEDWDYDSY